MTAKAMAERRSILIAGGGAAGFFGAIACAEADPRAEVTLYEATDHPLAKVRVSGGGRCNVTHACFDARELAKSYPRGSQELIGPLTRFGPSETVAWFKDRGVELKTEGDGRMFPVSNDSATIVRCLQDTARRAGVRLVTRCGLRSLSRDTSLGEPLFRAELARGESLIAHKVLIATGGGKNSAGLAVARAFGHTVHSPVPSLFTFHVDDPRLKGLEGLAVPWAEVSVVGSLLREKGPILITHWGLSGPAVLRISAWGARTLQEKDYRFELRINCAPDRRPEEAKADLEGQRTAHPKRLVSTSNPWGIPSRFWERLVAAAGIRSAATWATVSNEFLKELVFQCTAAEFAVSGKSMNKEEFVTCGGVSLAEIDMATMESRLRPGLHFAGEALDIDGITGGYNFQSAWTTGWHAGRALART